MTEEPRVRRRARLRNKETEETTAQIAASLGGATLWAPTAAVETGEFLDRSVLLVDNKLVGLFEGATPTGPAFLTCRGLLAYKPQARFVTVDMGAIKFVTNGADVMAPGIVEADPALQPGDWCWIRDERNKQPLAVGKALVAGAAMVRGKGKAVKSVHHVGDKLWALE
ncbi:MAG: PUA domain-containing protein [Candidatus Thermoplasmatota archaeon]